MASNLSDDSSEYLGTQAEAPPDRRMLLDHTLDYNAMAQLSEDKHRYLRELKQGPIELLRKVWEDELMTGHNLRPEQQDTFLDAGMEILCSTPFSVLIDIMSGEVMEKYCSTLPSETKTYLLENEKRWKAQVADQRYQPLIYQHWLSDLAGNAPSARDVERIANDVLYYTQDAGNGFAVDIDTIVKGCPDVDWEAGERRYLETPQHFEAAKWFCQAMGRARQRATLRPFSETGYTTNGFSRLRQHRLHQSSNRYMNLVDAICQLKHPHLKLSQVVVYNIWDVQQAWAGEILFDRLSGGWIDDGHGFTSFHRGRNVGSSLKFSQDEWEKWCEYAFEHSPYISTFATCQDPNTRFTDTRTENMDEQSDRYKRIYQERDEKEMCTVAQYDALAQPLDLKSTREPLELWKAIHTFHNQS